jgi:hypothetical protein
MRRLLLNLVLCVLFLLASSASANNMNLWWNGNGDGSSWHDGGNWGGGNTPSGGANSWGDVANIGGLGYAATINSTTGSVAAKELKIAYGASGDGALNVNSGGSLDLFYHVNLGVDGTSSGGTLNINGGTLSTGIGSGNGNLRVYGNGHVVNLNSGTINVNGTSWGGQVTMGYAASAGSTTTFNVNGGTLNASAIKLGAAAGSGTNNFNMKAGEINLGMYFEIAYESNTTSHVQFDGGIITANDLFIRNDDDQFGTMDMTGSAKLILDGDDRANICSWYTDGRLTAYDGIGSLVIDYGVTNAGKTTVTVIPEPATITLLCMGGIALFRRKKRLSN